MFLQSTRIATHGVLALVSGNLVAFLLGFNEGLAFSGLFGYNSFLVGLALATFDSQATTQDKASDYHASVLVAVLVFAMFSSILFVMLVGKMLVYYKTPPLTLPFNIATLIFLTGMANMNQVDIDSVRPPALPDYNFQEQDGDLDITAPAFFAGVVRGVGQVYLANSLASGILVLVGIAICSRVGAVAAAVGSAVGAAVALATGVPDADIENGMFGFNSSLAFTAMFFFYSPSWGACILGLFAAVVMAVACQHALAALLEPWGLPFMTLPFCIATLPFIILQGTTSAVIAIPLAATTVPEDHYQKVATLTDGIEFLMSAIQKSSLDETTRSSDLEKGSESYPRLSSEVFSKRPLSRKMKRSVVELSHAIAREKKVENLQCCGNRNAEFLRAEEVACDIFEAIEIRRPLGPTS